MTRRAPVRGMIGAGAIGALVLAAQVGIIGCAGAPADGGALPSERDQRRAAEGSGGSALAVIDGEPVYLADLAPALLESAGGAALDERALDIAIARESRRRGVRVSDEDIRRERAVFIELLIDSGVADAGVDADRLLMDVRRARGLGPHRFNALLRRSASLRRMIQSDVVITEDLIQQIHRLEHGERYNARLITLATLAEAQRVRREIEDGLSFNEAAARYSTDASAPRGGILEPISPADTSYPASIRRAVAETTPGAISPPIGIDTGYALLLVESVTPADGVSIDEARTRLTELARRRQERLLMSQLARALRERTSVRVRDEHLRFGAPPDDR